MQSLNGEMVVACHMDQGDSCGGRWLDSGYILKDFLIDWTGGEESRITVFFVFVFCYLFLACAIEG